MPQMNIKEAIKLVKENCSWCVNIRKVNKNLYKIQHNLFEGGEYSYTSRELINLAETWTSNNKQSTALSKIVKRYTKKKDRAATRDLINTEQFDKIPQKGRVKEIDPWDYD
jgi:cob(I)alamin adenosyltransferase